MSKFRRPLILSNVRLSYTDHNNDGFIAVNASEIVSENNYYAFGMEHKGYNTAVQPIGSDKAQKIKYNGKELEEELGKDTYSFGWRDYDPSLGRFLKIDRFAEKYYGLTPYSYSGNNPLYFVDVQGDSINVSNILTYDKKNNTSYVQNIIQDLNSQTGLDFSVNTNGQLIYKTDENGNAVISTSTDDNGNVSQNGSEEARKIMMHAVSTTEQAYTRIDLNRGSGAFGTGSPLIGLNPNDISSMISGARNVDNRTLGWGMTFMHEILHSNVAEGGAFGHGTESTNFGETGTVVDRMNIVRAELNSQGGNYGTRRSYQAAHFNPQGGGASYLPFDSKAYYSMKNGNVPSTYSMYIKIIN